MSPIKIAKTIIQGTLKRLGYHIVKGCQIKNNRDWVMHLLYFKELYDLIANVDGDIVECGIGYGESLYKLCCLAYFENKGRRIYGFDSFEGFPEPSEEDRSPRAPRKGEWNVSTAKTICKSLETEIGKTFLQNNVTLVKGFFAESLHKYSGGKIAFLHLDVDLYRSYKETLEYFWPRVEKGGVVLFDEYKNQLIRFPGASKAIDEFLGDLVAQIQFNERANRYYIVKR
jgi:Macrocin-O-methyltransferase (TylF)